MSTPCHDPQPWELTPEWCMEAFYRVNPGATSTMPRGIPSLYLLDFAREVLRHAPRPPVWSPYDREIL